ncbi:U32 family peptidase [Methanothermobacter sp.]|uniref:U32 family peptidase n=1 Tax=Methanothermobacter sp. TaxID=1884223 RepID=UPI002604BC60|nr:U32 family peptidase [Methanothermobacter sp.]MDI9615358.1 U32 family peptidase [Methanothermobacter sp.]
MEIPELLAPAGSPDSFRVAINAGADAVYLSGKDFGARHYAENFSLQEIHEAVEYAHLHDRNVYVTVNTLLRDSELSDVAEYLQELSSAGADAVIIQDPALLVLRDELSIDLPFHASTQMTIHNRAGIRWAEQMGLERVILARELSIDEVSALAAESDVELEVFIHGALCYSYSGQCLLSSFIGGRSGNRGRCAQPCRKRYELIQLKPSERRVPLREEYLLSTRDISAYMHLQELVEAGVQSLKIEGRMRSPEYVATTVSVYRRALDEIKSGGWKPSEKEFDKLRLTFNRTLTGGHLFREDFMGREYPGDRGLPVGHVERYEGGRAHIRITSRIKPEAGDGLFFQGTGKGMYVHDHRYDGGLLSVPSGPVKEGALVYLTGRKSLQKFTEKLRRSSPGKCWDIELKFTADKDGMVDLTAEWMMNGLRLRESVETQFERALKRPLNEDTIKNHLLRVGDKPFRLTLTEFRYPGGLFYPLSRLNALRRELLMRVERRILRERRPHYHHPKPASHHPDRRLPEAPCISVYVEDLKAMKSALRAGAGRVYLEPQVHGDFRICDDDDIISVLERASEVSSRYGAEAVWKWPDITHDWLFERLLEIEGDLSMDLMVGGYGIPDLINCDVKVYGSPALNIFNSRSAALLSGKFHLLTLSPELSWNDLQRIQVPAEIIVHGNLTAMVTRDNLWKLAPPDFDTSTGSRWGIMDSRGAVFPINQLLGCETVIMNSRETCLIDFLPSLPDAGFRNFSIDCRIQSPERTRLLVESYVSALESPERIPDIKERIVMESPAGVTASHFRRGLAE